MATPRKHPGKEDRVAAVRGHPGSTTALGQIVSQPLLFRNHNRTKRSSEGRKKRAEKEEGCLDTKEYKNLQRNV